MLAAVWSSPEARADDQTSWLALRRSTVVSPVAATDLTITAGLSFGGGNIDDRLSTRSAISAGIAFPVRPRLSLNVAADASEASHATRTSASFPAFRLATVITAAPHLTVVAGLDTVLLERPWPGRPLGWLGLHTSVSSVQFAASVEVADAPPLDDYRSRAEELRGDWQFGTSLAWRPVPACSLQLAWRGARSSADRSSHTLLAEIAGTPPSLARGLALTPWLRIAQPVAGDPARETWIGLGLRAVVRVGARRSAQTAEDPASFDPFAD